MSCNNATDPSAKANAALNREREAWKAEEQSWNEQMAQLRAALESTRAELAKSEELVKELQRQQEAGWRGYGSNV